MKLHTARALSVSVIFHPPNFNWAVHLPYSRTYPAVSTWSEGFPSQNLFWLQTSSVKEPILTGQIKVRPSRCSQSATLNIAHMSVSIWTLFRNNRCIDLFQKDQVATATKRSKIYIFSLNCSCIIMQVQQDNKSRTLFLSKGENGLFKSNGWLELSTTVQDFGVMYTCQLLRMWPHACTNECTRFLGHATFEAPYQGSLSFIHPSFFERPSDTKTMVEATQDSMLCKGVPGTMDSDFIPLDGASARFDGEGTVTYHA